MTTVLKSSLCCWCFQLMVVCALLSPAMTYALHPEITNVAPATATVGTVYSHQILAIDPEEGALTYSLKQAPQAMSISATGLLTWTPVHEDAGYFRLILQVMDEEGLSKAQTIELVITDPNNQLPVVGQPAITTVVVGEEYNYNLQASDNDGDSLTYSIVSYPARNGLSISESGIVNWTPMTRDDAGDIYVVITINDGHLGITKHEYYLSIIDSGNSVPVVGQEPLTTINYTETYHYDLQATDDDGDTLSYRVSSYPFKPELNISDTGVVTWAPSSRDDVGDVFISIRIDDAHGGITNKSFNLQVTDPDNHLPVVESEPPTTVNYGEMYQYDLKASDEDGDTLTYSVSSYPLVTGMAFDEEGILRWTPATRENVGVVSIVVKVNDGRYGITEKSYFLQVTDPDNKPPVIGQEPQTQVNIGEQYSYDLMATDADGDALTYSVFAPPNVDGMVISDTGVLTWIPSRSNIGEVFISIRVRDRYLGEARSSYYLLVNDPDDPISPTTDTDGDGVPNVNDTDDDNDGIPDVIEIHAGLNPLNANDAVLDKDGDTVNNLQEYLGNTENAINSITNNTIYPAVQIKTFLSNVTAVEAVGGSAELHWEVIGAATVELFHNANKNFRASLSAQGTAMVRPQINTKYRLVATGPGGQEEKTVMISIDGQAPKPRWVANTEVLAGNAINSSFAVDEDGNVYVGSFDENYYKLDPSGGIQWKLPGVGIVKRRPALTQDAVIFGANGNGADRGKICSVKKQHSSTSENQINWIVKANSPVIASPVLNDSQNIVYAVSYTGRVYAIDLAEETSRRVMWEFDLPVGSLVTATPVLSRYGDALIINTTGGNVFALNIPDNSVGRSLGDSTINNPVRIIWNTDIQAASKGLRK